jgi:hypothetical protein
MTGISSMIGIGEETSTQQLSFSKSETTLIPPVIILSLMLSDPVGGGRGLGSSVAEVEYSPRKGYEEEGYEEGRMLHNSYWYSNLEK